MPLVVIDWMDLTQRPGEHGARAKSSRERRAPRHVSDGRGCIEAWRRLKKKKRFKKGKLKDKRDPRRPLQAANAVTFSPSPSDFFLFSNLYLAFALQSWSALDGGGFAKVSCRLSIKIPTPATLAERTLLARHHYEAYGRERPPSLFPQQVRLRPKELNLALPVLWRAACPWSAFVHPTSPGLQPENPGARAGAWGDRTPTCCHMPFRKVPFFSCRLLSPSLFSCNFFELRHESPFKI